MADLYSYDDFQKALNSSGLAGQFSDADLKLAQTNPSAGMSLLNYKIDYNNATTDEARILANAGAEGIRSTYGGYTGGSTGAGYYATGLSPNSFSYESAPTYTASDSLVKPTYTDNYSDQIAGILGQYLNYGDYSYDPAPTYDNQYADTINGLLGQVTNRQDFSWDPETDPLTGVYRKQYAREGQRATQDALGSAAAATGGIPSSYAMTAASQAGDYYAAQMADKYPELYELAYQKYLNDFNMDLSSLGAAQSVEQQAFNEYLAELGQYNTDRSFDYGVWSDAYDRLGNNLGTLESLQDNEYNRYLNELNQYNLDRDFDYNAYLSELGQYNTDRSFAYGNLLDEISNQANVRAENLNRALTAAQFGDYSYLNAQDINTDYAQRQNALEDAITAANYGDYSGLQALGIDTSIVEFETRFRTAALAAQYGDYSGLQALGINVAAGTGYGGGGTGSGGSSGGRSGSGMASSGADGADWVSVLRQELGGSVITDGQALQLIQANPWLTKQMLQDNGFTISYVGDWGGGSGNTVSRSPATPSQADLDAWALKQAQGQQMKQEQQEALVQQAMLDYLARFAVGGNRDQRGSAGGQLKPNDPTARWNLVS